MFSRDVGMKSTDEDLARHGCDQPSNLIYRNSGDGFESFTCVNGIRQKTSIEAGKGGRNGLFKLKQFC